MVLNALKTFLTQRRVQESSNTRRRLNLGAEAPVYPIYAIGDVHGCLDQLYAAEERILEDISRNERKGLVVLLGDYIDRGPNSAGVLAHLRESSPKGLKRVALCGNHDDILSTLLEHPEKISDWISFGGAETLLSYGVDLEYLSSRSRLGDKDLLRLIGEAIPEADFKFLRSLPVSLRAGPYLFVHAGIKPGVEMDQQSDEDLMWIRQPFISRGPEAEFVVIHGHTPHSKPSIGPKRIGIDTRAYATGNLTVLKLDNGKASIV